MARNKPHKPAPAEAVAVPAASAVTDATAAASEAFERALAEFFVQAPGVLFEDSVSSQVSFVGPEASRESVNEYLSFRLSDELYAVSILFIREIIKPSLFTHVPRTATVVLGVLSLRGTIVPVVDLRLLLGLDALPQTRRSRILIVTSGDELVGLLVDEVRHVIRLGLDEIEPPPAVFDRAEAEHMIGVGRYDGEMYTLVDLKSLVQLERFILGASGGRKR